MKIRKVGRVKASEVKAYQKANGLVIDGKAGNQTVGHMIDSLERCRNQPDDPGAAPDWDGMGRFSPLTAYLIAAAVVITIGAVTAAYLTG